MLRSLTRRFRADTRGGVLLIFGLALPILRGLAGAAVTYGQLVTRRAELQKAADTAVLAATRELSLANVEDARIVSVASTAALDALTYGRTTGTSATPEPAVVRDATGQRAGVQVTLTETVASPLGRLLSLPTSTLVVRAAAKLVGSGKVCLIGLDTRLKATVYLRKSSQISATGCGLYANSSDREGLVGDDNAIVKASLVCSAGGFREGKKGTSFQPAPLTGCPAMGDPLIARPAPYYPGGCATVSEVRGLTNVPRPKKPKKGAVAVAADVVDPSVVIDPGTGVDLSPGLYCDGLTVDGGAKVRLKPGIYVMRGPLVVDAASLTGENVGFYFEGDQASLLFDYDSSISLTAPRTGDMAGLLLFEERRVSLPDEAPAGKTKGKAPPKALDAPPLREYRIISDDAQMLLGTIYLPSGRLIIDSEKPVAAQSAYTVVVARLIELFDGPNLVLNTNYGGTDIPVPKGVGPVPGNGVGLSQ